jgi:hypothetical protein
LLCEPTERLGAHGVQEILGHQFFAGFDWKNVRNMKPPFVPQLANDSDFSYFDTDELEPDELVTKTSSLFQQTDEDVSEFSFKLPK